MKPDELLRRIKLFLQRDRMTQELEEEMRIHVSMRAEKVGLTDARRRFGNATSLQEESRDAWRVPTLEDLMSDTRFAVRRLVKRPGFSLSVIAILAIGIGATTAMFSAVDATFLRPLPFRSGEQLVVLPEIAMPNSRVGPAPELDVLDVRGFTDLFSEVAVYGDGAVNLSDATNPLRLNASTVTPNFFSVLGVVAFRGRLFAQNELKPGTADVVVISYALWQRQYGGRDISGLTVSLNDVQHRVVGVMPKGFNFPAQSDVWIPLAIPSIPVSVRVFRDVRTLTAIARLKSGVSVSYASQQMLQRWKQHAQNRPLYTSDGSHNLLDELRSKGGAIQLRQLLAGDRRSALLILLGATGLLLLVACGNVSNLLLAQASSRQREIAMRRVLGASRARVIRQLLIEAVVLSLAGALSGIALAFGALQFIKSMMPAKLLSIAPAVIDLRVLGFGVTLAIGTGLLFGLWPALGSSRGDASSAIKSGDGRGVTGLRAGHMRRVLLVGELALTSMLLVGATLMMRSFDRLMNEEIGLRAEQVGTVELTLPTINVSVADRLRRINEMVERLSAIPGIQSAGVVNDLPLSGVNGLLIGIRVDGIEPSKNTPPMRFLQASGGYFETMGIRLLEGRLFRPIEDSATTRIAIISETVARRFWPGQSAVGRIVHGPGAFGEFTVVGVVSDLREKRVEDAPSAQLYMPVQTRIPSTVALVARSDMDPQVLLRRMNEVVRSVDPSQAVFNLRMMDDVVGTSVAPRRINMQLIAIFALLGVLLASVGVYSVVSYGVASRSKELGIRSALGASGAVLLRMISREMVWVSVVGVAVGLAGAWTLAQALQGLVYGIDVHDALSFALVPFVLLLPTMLATLIPAWRAYRVNPADVMRADQ